MLACSARQPALLDAAHSAATSRRRRQRPFAAPAAALGPPLVATSRCHAPAAAAAAAAAACRLLRAQPPQQQQQRSGHQQHRRQRLQPAAALPEALALLEASPARDVAAAMVAVCGSLALIKFFDTLERLGVIDKVGGREPCGVLGLSAGVGRKCALVACAPLPRPWRLHVLLRRAAAAAVLAAAWPCSPDRRCPSTLACWPPFMPPLLPSHLSSPHASPHASLLPVRPHRS